MQLSLLTNRTGHMIWWQSNSKQIYFPYCTVIHSLLVRGDHCIGDWFGGSDYCAVREVTLLVVWHLGLNNKTIISITCIRNIKYVSILPRCLDGRICSVQLYLRWPFTCLICRTVNFFVWKLDRKRLNQCCCRLSIKNVLSRDVMSGCDVPSWRDCRVSY